MTKDVPMWKGLCVSMVTHKRAREDTLTIVKALRKKIDAISALITPTIVTKKWLYNLKKAGADRISVAVDAATPKLFDKLRGRGVGGPHRWDRYWQVVEDSIEIFGKYNVDVHFIAGLGKTEEEMVKTIQKHMAWML